MPRPVENVWKYPRPPALLKTAARLRVVWKAANGEEKVVADTNEGWRVLETSHPPTYYFPLSSIAPPFSLKPSSQRQTYCEWKGKASYWDLFENDTLLAKGRIWSYPQPTSDFKPIKDYLCFYATSKSDLAKQGVWKSFVDEDEAKAQEGDFYGSWITPEIEGGEKGFKGGAGTWGW